MNINTNPHQNNIQTVNYKHLYHELYEEYTEQKTLTNHLQNQLDQLADAVRQHQCTQLIDGNCPNCETKDETIDNLKREIKHLINQNNNNINDFNELLEQHQKTIAARMSRTGQALETLAMLLPKIVVFLIIASVISPAVYILAKAIVFFFIPA